MGAERKVRATLTFTTDASDDDIDVIYQITRTEGRF